MAKPRSVIVAYLEASGPATSSEIASALGWQKCSLSSALSKLRHLNQIHVCGTTDGRENVWDCGAGEQKRPDPQAIVTAAIASQPALATVWRAA